MPKASKARKPSTSISDFQKVLKSSKNIIALAGAGLSAASGIPTFRGTGGLWRKFDVISMATEDAFYENPSRLWQFYHYRREKANACKPNLAHYALAEFSLPYFRSQLGLAKDSKFTLITQNVDGLSKRALEETCTPEVIQSISEDPAHPPMIEMHGRVNDVKCSSPKCGHIEFNPASPICPALDGTEAFVDEDIEKTIAEDDLPRCSKCKALARPGVVWFGEVPYDLEKIDDLVEEADLCIVVGTSSTVYPAAGYAAEVQAHGGKVAVFNLERSAGDKKANFLFLGPCEETLPSCLGIES
ncbi:DHS-like NAD/FAD-binding domain-containing protein [Schizopora paradoxa]|uniref:NAD-dependent protein deacylase n=1 Tax=Schizopora paradoxa TaxID=27342 RepID=A0A0H2S1L3_9AGAM|nr:DHS-like NAD/FAD-binding domain-containing protein [Schizopora paradoxa]